jgi:hypothetical protein
MPKPILPPSDGASPFMRAAHLCYYGAFLALGIQNLDVAADLARVTRTEDELVQAVARLRGAVHANDRVWPVLNWLRELRSIEALSQGGTPTVIACGGSSGDATIPSPPPSEET